MDSKEYNELLFREAILEDTESLAELAKSDTTESEDNENSGTGSSTDLAISEALSKISDDTDSLVSSMSSLLELTKTGVDTSIAMSDLCLEPISIVTAKVSGIYSYLDAFANDIEEYEVFDRFKSIYNGLTELTDNLQPLLELGIESLESNAKSASLIANEILKLNKLYSTDDSVKITELTDNLQPLLELGIESLEQIQTDFESLLNYQDVTIDLLEDIHNKQTTKNKGISLPKISLPSISTAPIFTDEMKEWLKSSKSTESSKPDKSVKQDNGKTERLRNYSESKNLLLTNIAQESSLQQVISLIKEHSMTMHDDINTLKATLKSQHVSKNSLFDKTITNTTNVESQVNVSVNDAGIKSFMSLAAFVASKKSVKKFTEGIQTIVNAMKPLVQQMTELAKLSKDTEKVQKFLDNLADTSKKHGSTLKSFGSQLLMLAVGVAGIALTFRYIGWDAILLGAVTFAGAIAIITATVAITSKIFDSKAVDKTTHNILAFGASLGIMALSLAAFAALTKIFTGGELLAGLGMLAASMILLSVTAAIGKKATKDIAFAFAGISLSLLVFSASLLLFDKVIETISWEALGMAMGSLLGLAVVTRIIGSMDKGVYKGILVTAAIAGMLWLLPTILKSWTGITPDMLATPGIALGGMMTAALATALIGKLGSSVFIGLGLVAGLTGVLYFVSKVVQELATHSIKDLEVPGIIMGGMLVAAGITAAIGAIGPMALIGLAVVAGIAGSLWIVSKALQNFADVAKTLQDVDLDVNKVTRITKGFAVLATGLMFIGNPITMIPVMAGIGAATLMAKAINELSTALIATEGVDLSKSTKTSEQILKWAVSTMKNMEKIRMKDVWNAMKALTPVKLMATSLASMVSALTLMANGTYTEYEIQNGKQVPVAVHQIGPELYVKFANSINELITGIQGPIIELGTGRNVFGSDFERGLKMLSKVDTIVDPIVKIANTSDKIEELNKTVIVKLGSHVQDLIDNLKTAVSGLGDGSRWYKSTNFEAGLRVFKKIPEAIDPVIEFANNYQSIEDISLKSVGDNVSGFINSISTALTSAASSNIKEGIKNFKDIDKLAKPIKSLSEGISDFDTETAKIVIQVANAMDTLGSISLPKINNAKNNVVNELYNKLDEINERLGTINESTLTVASTIDSKEFGNTMPAQPTRTVDDIINTNPLAPSPDQPVDLTLIYGVLIQIYNKISYKRR